MDEISQILDRGVAAIYPNKESLLKVLKGDKKLTIYYGIDPSGSILHLGHAVILKKLAQFQKLGHKIILLVGDFTGMIGDPTDKSAARKQLTHKEVLENASKYQEQASKILNFSGKNPAEIKYNHNWLSKLTLEDIVRLASHFTVQQMVERDMFQKRIKDKKPIFIHEFLYPLMQGYDSVAMNVDLEVGGSDQTFNMLIGREVVKIYKKKEKFVLTIPLLLGTDGRKMGKSEGNFISITDPAETMFKKIMSLDDDLIVDYFFLTTDLTDVEIKKIIQDVKNGKLQPQKAKAILATQIVSQYYDKTQANKTNDKYQKGDLRETSFSVNKPRTYISTTTISQITFDIGLAKSVSEAKQIILQGGLKVNGTIVNNPQQHLDFKKEITFTRANNKEVIISIND